MNDILPKKKRKLLIPVLAAVAGVLVVGFVVSQAGLDKALVKQKLDESILAIKEKGRAQGRDIDITYGDLEVAGTFLDKRVIVHQPVLTVKPLNRAPLAPGAIAKPDSLVITTDEMAIYPRSVDLSSATFSLAKPINFAAENAPEKSLLKVEASAPLAVTVSQKTIDGVAHTLMQHTAPANLTLTYLREETVTGTEDATPEVKPEYSTMLVNIASGSTISSDSATDGSGLGRAAFDFGKISLVPQAAPETAIEIAGIHSKWSNVLNEKKLNVVTAKSEIGPISANADVLPYGPIAFGLDFVFEGASAKASPAAAAVAASAPQEATITLNKLSLTTKDSGLSAHANFVASPTDILPVGTAELKLTNVPFILGELRKIGVLNAQTEGRYVPMIEQIAGAPIASITDLEVPIKRERGGSFHIGKTTFEELFALLLKQAIQPKDAGSAPASEAAPAPAPQSRALVPQLPSADKPKSTPIQVPDNGVRG